MRVSSARNDSATERAPGIYVPCCCVPASLSPVSGLLPSSRNCEYATIFEAMRKSARLSSSIRDDEEFVITAVAAAFGGSWRHGEDPPDGYLTVGTESIAVEISTLTQHV